MRAVKKNRQVTILLTSIIFQGTQGITNNNTEYATS